MNRPDDPSDRDAHLMTALRHAPDRDALPPADLTAAILARAREQARLRGTPPAWRRLFDAWRLPPHAAAAFGSVAVAVVVGVMWSVNEPAPSGREKPAPSGREEPAAGPAAVAPAASAATPAAPVSVAPSPAPRQAPRRADAAAPGAPATRPSATASSAVAEPPLLVPRTALAQAAPAPPPVAESSAAMPAASVLRYARSPAARPAPALSPAANTASDAAVGAAVGATAGPSSKAAESASAPDPLVRLAAALDAAGAAALWRLAGRTVAHGAAQQAWWAGLRDATRGRWTREPAAPATPPWLDLLLPGVRTDARAGDAAASLWLEPGDAPALVLRTDGGVWRAPLAPTLPASWQQDVAGW